MSKKTIKTWRVTAVISFDITANDTAGIEDAIHDTIAELGSDITLKGTDYEFLREEPQETCNPDK